MLTGKTQSWLWKVLDTTWAFHEQLKWGSWPGGDFPPVQECCGENNLTSTKGEKPEQPTGSDHCRSSVASPEPRHCRAPAHSKNPTMVSRHSFKWFLFLFHFFFLPVLPTVFLLPSWGPKWIHEITKWVVLRRKHTYFCRTMTCLKKFICKEETFHKVHQHTVLAQTL